MATTGPVTAGTYHIGTVVVCPLDGSPRGVVSGGPSGKGSDNAASTIMSVASSTVPSMLTSDVCSEVCIVDSVYLSIAVNCESI